mgnify:CR=1 FL=1
MVLTAASTVVSAACAPEIVVKSIEDIPAPTVAVAAVFPMAAPMAANCDPPMVMPPELEEVRLIEACVVAAVNPLSPAVVAPTVILRPSNAVMV